MGLAVLSGSLSILSVGAAFVGILPSRGGESIFHDGADRYSTPGRDQGKLVFDSCRRP